MSSAPYEKKSKRGFIGPDDPYGARHWLTTRESERTARTPDRVRLERCIRRMAASKVLSKSDAGWVLSILRDIYVDKDVRLVFNRPKSAGRKHRPDDHQFFIALDAAVMRTQTGAKGKRLWGMLAEKWGYPDGSIKNFITKHDKEAQGVRLYFSDDEIAKYMPENLARYKKAQQSN